MPDAADVNASPANAGDLSSELCSKYVELAIAVFDSIARGGNPGRVIELAGSVHKLANSALLHDPDALVRLWDVLTGPYGEGAAPSKAWRDEVPAIIDASLDVVMGRLSKDRRTEAQGEARLALAAKKIADAELAETINRFQEMAYENALLRQRAGLPLTGRRGDGINQRPQAKKVTDSPWTMAISFRH